MKYEVKHEVKPIIVLDSQKERLKEILTNEEYTNLMSYLDDGFWFQTELASCAVNRFVDDEPTEEAYKLEKIYDEIYLQNIPK